MKRRALFFMGAASLCLAAAAGAQGSYPEQPIKMVVPFPPGGPVDNVARILGEAMAKDLGQPVLIENRPGAGGVIGTVAVSKAAPNGYTLGVSNADSLITGPILVPSAGYDASRDLDLISQVAYGRQTLVVNPAVEATSLPELLELARRNPDTIHFASFGPGSRPELVFAEIGSNIGVQLTGVPYRGFAPALQDLLANRVQVGLVPSSLATEFAAKNLLRPIVVFGQERDPVFLPDVTTSVEQGVHLPIMDTHMWVMVFGPRDLPAGISARLTDAIQRALADKNIAERLLGTGHFVMPGIQGAELARSFAEEQALIGGLTRRFVVPSP